MKMGLVKYVALATIIFLPGFCFYVAGKMAVVIELKPKVEILCKASQKSMTPDDRKKCVSDTLSVWPLKSPY